MESMHKRDIAVYTYCQHHTKHLLYSVPITAYSRVEIRRLEPPIMKYEELSQLCDVINLKCAVLTILATNAQGRKRLPCTATAVYNTAKCEVVVYHVANCCCVLSSEVCSGNTIWRSVKWLCAAWRNMKWQCTIC